MSKRVEKTRHSGQPKISELLIPGENDSDSHYEHTKEYYSVRFFPTFDIREVVAR